MDIGVDLSTPKNDLKKTEDGKYLYRIEGDRFEIDRFNRDFDQYKERRKKAMEKKMGERLAELNKPDREAAVYNQPIGTIMIKTKDALFGILDDLLQFNFSKEVIIKENRLFFIGITILIVSFILYFYDILTGFNGKKTTPQPQFAVEFIHKFEGLSQPVKTTNISTNQANGANPV